MAWNNIPVGSPSGCHDELEFGAETGGSDKKICNERSPVSCLMQGDVLGCQFLRGLTTLTSDNRYRNAMPAQSKHHHRVTSLVIKDSKGVYFKIAALRHFSVAQGAPLSDCQLSVIDRSR